MVSELGAAFYPHGEAGASRKHALKKTGVSWADEAGKRFSPSMYSTPAEQRAGRGRSSRSAELARANSGLERRNLLEKVKGMKEKEAGKEEKEGGSPSQSALPGCRVRLGVAGPGQGEQNV